MGEREEQAEEQEEGVIKWPCYLLPFIPIATVPELFVHPDPTWVFVTAALGRRPEAGPGAPVVTGGG